MQEIKLNYIQLHLILFVLLSIIQISCNESNIDDNSPIEGIEQESIDALKLGVKLLAPTPQPEIYFDDLIHPCVRFIPEGLNGHQWWMIGTPYRGGDRFIENPILYYGDSRPGGLPPIEWKASAIVVNKPLLNGAYNSDPNLYFDGNKLWIFWRENMTESCIKLKMTRATFGVNTIDGKTFSDKKYYAGEPSSKEDNEMCPTVIEINGKIKLFGVKHQFETPRVPLGLSIWEIEENNLENNVFIKTKDIQPIYKQGFDLWHTDFFMHNNAVYCVATPEIANEVLLGVSLDGENFTFWDKPLLSSKGTSREYFYKASAMVHNGVFYLWTPVAEQGITPRTSRIWMSEILFEDLMENLNSKVISFSSTNRDNALIKLSASLHTINIEVLTGAETLYIYNLTGSLVYKNNLTTGKHQISLKNGFYIVNVLGKSHKVFVP